MLISVTKNNKVIGEFDCNGIFKEGGVLNIYHKECGCCPITFADNFETGEIYDYIIK